MSSFLSAGVGARMPSNLVPGTGISGRMFTMYAPLLLTSFTSSGIEAALTSGTITMFALTSIPSSAHLPMPSSCLPSRIEAPSSPVRLSPSHSTEP